MANFLSSCTSTVPIVKSSKGLKLSLILPTSPRIKLYPRRKHVLISTANSDLMSAVGGRQRQGPSLRANRLGPTDRLSLRPSIHVSLTEQQQLDLPGSLFSVVPKVPVDHLAALLRRLVVRAQSTSHLRMNSPPDK